VNRIDTDRLELHAFEPSLVVALHEIFMNPGVRHFLLDEAIVDREWVGREIAESQKRVAGGGLGLWAVRVRGGSRWIGFTGYREFYQPPQLQLLYALLPEVWHRGLATEMAHAVIDHTWASTRMTEIRASIDEPNVASGRVLERLGFTRIGSSPGDHGWMQVHFAIAREAHAE